MSKDSTQGEVSNTNQANSSCLKKVMEELRGNPLVIFPVLGVAFMPLYRTAILENSFITPKLGLLGVLVSLGLIGGFISGAWKRVRWSYPLTSLLVIFFSLTVFSAVWASSLPAAVYGMSSFLLFFGFYIVTLFSLRNGRAAKLIMSGGAIAAVITAGWTVAEDYGFFTKTIGARLPDWRGKLSAGLGNSGHIAGFIGLFLPWLLLKFITADKFSVLKFSGILLSFAALVVTWSVGSTGAFILSCCLWGTLALFIPAARKLLKISRIMAVVGGGLMVTAWFFIPHEFNSHRSGIFREAFGSQRWADGWPTRLVIWQTTGSIVKSHPFTGVGIGNFTYEYVQQIVPEVMANPTLRIYAGMFTNDAHNDYLHVWSELGIFGMLLWMGIVGTFIVIVVKKIKNCKDEFIYIYIAVGAGGTVFFLDSLMSFPMQLPSHFASLMAIFAIAAGQREESSNEKRRTGKMVPAAAITVAVLFSTYTITNRVIAEYYLKVGRGMVESQVVMSAAGPMTEWQAADSLYRGLLENIASGQFDMNGKQITEMMKSVSTTESFKSMEYYLDKSLTKDAFYSNASSRLGMLLLFQGRYDEMLKVCDQTLRTLQTVEIYERMGLAQFLSGNTDAAKASWLLCAERMPNMADFYLALAESAESR